MTLPARQYTEICPNEDKISCQDALTNGKYLLRRRHTRRKYKTSGVKRHRNREKAKLNYPLQAPNKQLRLQMTRLSQAGELVDASDSIDRTQYSALYSTNH